MKEINGDFYFPELEEFLFVGKEYCAYVEKISNKKPEEVFEFFRKILPYLYVKASMLPENLPTEDDFIQRYVTEEDYEIVFNEIREKIEKLEPYYVFDMELREPEKISIAEILTDIYQDIKDLLLAYQRGLLHEKMSTEKFAYAWFMERIGTHIARVLPAFHDAYLKNASEKMKKFNL